MITPSFGLTATERVLPRLALDWTTGVAQPGVDVTRAGVSTYVDSSGIIQLASADTQRIDYLTGIAGLLVEESRTNLLINSNTLSTGWIGYGASVSATTESSPVQGSNYVKIVESGNNERHLYTSGGTFPAVAYVFSIYAKKAERKYITITRTSGGANYYSATVDLDTGEITQELQANAGAWKTTVTPAKDGAWRISNWTSMTAGNYCWISTATSGTFANGGQGTQSYQGDGSSGVYVIGAQCEAGAFATSYIPTEATAVTRNADVATMTGTNFSDWFNATEGTFVAKAASTVTAVGSLYTLANGDGANPRVNIARINATTLRARVLIDVVQADLDLTLAQQLTHCFAYKQDSFAAALNGSAVVTDTSGNVPTTLDKFHIGKYSAASPDWNGHIQKILYYPQRLTNAEVQAFSKG